MADDLFEQNQKITYRIQNMFRGNKKQPSKTVPEPSLSNISQPTTPSTSTPEQPQDVGIGNRFIDQFLPTEADGESNQPIDQTAPTQPVMQDLEQILTSYKETIKQSGFKDSEENLQRFVDQNPDPNVSNYNFSGLQKDDNIAVDAPKDIINNALTSVPIFQVMSGLKKPIEILGEAFSRWEAAKVNLIKGALNGQIPDVIGGLTGASKTEFPEATLRSSNLPEMGDFFRAKGVPEFCSALGGFALDAIAGIPELKGAERLLKIAGKGSAIKGITNISEAVSTKATEKLMALKASRSGRYVIDMLKGKSRFDVGPTPVAFKQAVRESFGDSNLTSFDANTLVNDMSRIFTKRGEDFAPTMDKALKGDITSLGKLDPAEQTVIKQARSILDEGSNKLKQELQYLQTTDPDRYKNLDELIDTMRKNDGNYVTRSFDLYTKKNWKPSADIINNSAKQLVEQGISKDETAARELIDKIIKKQEVNVTYGSTGQFKIGPNTFKSRLPLPEPIRNLLGEIQDPRFNLMNTSRKISEAQNHLKVFRWMRENGYVSSTKTAEFTEKVHGGPLAWGAIEGMYTSPDIADTLKGMQNAVNNLDTTFLKFAQGIKAFKTVFNPKAQAHNWLGSLTFFAPLSGVSVFNKPQRYKEAIEVINAVKKVRQGTLPKTNPLYQIYRDAVKNRVVGNELPNADQIKWLEEFIANEGNLPEAKTLLEKGKRSLQSVARGAATSYALGDIIPKLATYLDYTKGRKLNPAQATEELYKWFQNPFEVSKLADAARNTAAGAALANPFISFRSEAHRILLNAMKEPRTRLIAAMYMGSRAAFNASVLGAMGLGMKDIGEYFMTRPESMTELVLNPANKEGNADLNTRYIDPFNTRGLFAPLLALSGATGVSPFDYALDFTTLSPDFGYSNLVINALTPAITGRGKYGEQLSFGERVRKTLEAAGPSSITIDVPKGIEAAQEGDNPEAIRRAFRFLGIDLEKRNPEYIRGEIAQRLVNTLQEGKSPDSLLKVLRTMGFDEQKMLKNAMKKINDERRLPPNKQKVVQYSVLDRVLEGLKD